MVHFFGFYGSKALVSSAEAPTKLVPLSDLISLIFPLQPINLRKHIRKQSLLREFAGLNLTLTLTQFISDNNNRITQM